MNPRLPKTSLTLRIVRTSVLIFICYFVIGLQLAVVPAFVHYRLGFNAIVAGVAISMQYVATLLSRPFAGRMADRMGGKFTASSGLLTLGVSGCVFLLSTSFQRPPAALGVLLLSRLILGTGESCVATGSTVWGISRVGADHTAEVISWSGIASYGALAVGAPIGVWLENSVGPAAIGFASVAPVVAGFLWSLAIRPTPIFAGKQASFQRVVARIFPFGMSLALGGAGFGIIASFVVLYYTSRHWQNGAFALSVFGVSFIAARLLFAKTINRWGGYRVAIVSLGLECVGLVLLWIAPVPALALAGAAVSGFGFSLVFPALGVEAVQQFRPHNRGSALGVYTAFVDLSMGISGPVAGVIVVGLGFPPIFLFAAVLAGSSLILSTILYRKQRGVGLECERGTTLAVAAAEP